MSRVTNAVCVATLLSICTIWAISAHGDCDCEQGCHMFTMQYNWGVGGTATEFDPHFTGTNYYTPSPDGGLKWPQMGYRFRNYPTGSPLCDGCVGTQLGAGSGEPGPWTNLEQADRGFCSHDTPN